MSFEIKSIGDVCSVGDGAHSKVKRIESGISYLTSKNIGQGFLKLEKQDYISEESFEKLFSKDSKATRRPQAGDVLFGIIGSFGSTYLYKKTDHFGFSSSIGILRPNPEHLEPEYLYYVVSSKVFRNNHANHNSGSVQGYTNIPTVKGLQIPVPSLVIQKKIARILQSLDDKITLNTQTNQTLEEMAQAIFKSWFVDFDPVKAKMRGGQPEGMDADTASLFPDKLVESELGMIPEGWEAGALSHVAEYCSARTGTETVSIENYISTENMLAEKKGVTTAVKLPIAKTIAAYKTGDILVSNIRPYFKKIWLAEGNGGRSNDVLGFESIAPNTDSYLMNLLYQDTFFEYMTRTSKGAKMPRGDKTAIMNWEMAVPPVELREAFSIIVDNFYKLIPQNRAQNATLESLRETLLPKLLAGEIELADNEVGKNTSEHPDYLRLEESIRKLAESVSKYKSDEGGILDSKFKSQCKSMPYQSLLELELADYLISLNIDISSRDEGPDFQLKKALSSDSIWLEAVCPKNGNDTPNGEVQVQQKSRKSIISAPLRDPDYERRLTAVLAEKSRKYKGYLEREIVAPTDDCLIVVSTDEINTHYLPFEQQRIASVLFNESPVIEINRFGESRRQDMGLFTKSGEPISCSFFDSNSFITGVVYKDRGDFVYFSPKYRAGISLKEWITDSAVESALVEVN